MRIVPVLLIRLSSLTCEVSFREPPVWRSDHRITNGNSLRTLTARLAQSTLRIPSVVYITYSLEHIANVVQ